MLLVKEVTGPAKVNTGEQVTYTVSKFNQENPPVDEAGCVSWLVKAQNGVALTNVPQQGPKWTLAIPQSWAGQTICVMPYMNSASQRIAVTTQVAALAQSPVAADPVTVQVFAEDRRYYASINAEPRFFVGIDVRYGTLRGLMNSANPYGPRYAPELFEPHVGFWAYYLLPTIQCESKGAFNCINTYDRARFTLGHMQFAAHTPNANFTPLFRELLRLPSAGAYFPELSIQNNRIVRKNNGQQIQLESDESTLDLQTFLNPTGEQVDPDEVTVAAKFMDWCARDPQFTTTMAGFAFRDQLAKLRLYAAKLDLNGISDKLCIVIQDILHQGRGKYAAITSALTKADPFDALLSIGAATYRERVATLRAGILELERKGIVGQRVYSNAAQDFVLADAA